MDGNRDGKANEGVEPTNARAESTHGLANRRILAIDDEPALVDAIRRVLEPENFHVTVATSASAGLKMLATSEFSVILSDNLMPEVKGLDLLADAVRIAPQSRRVLITGYTDLNEAIEAFNQGILHRYLAKPWKRDELIALVNTEWSAYFRAEEANRALEARERSVSERAHLLETAVSLLRKATSSEPEENSTDVVERRLTVILHGDVVGFSRLMGEDHEGTMRQLTQCRDQIHKHVSHHHGRVVNAVGDALLVEFGSAINGVQCAIDIQRQQAEQNRLVPRHRQMMLRLGINSGEVLVKDGDIYGDGVNIAARLQSLAHPGGLCISEPIYRLVRSRLPLQYEFMGEKSLKNISEPIGVYAVVMEPTAAEF